jgi:uncharacterized protein affecting Mg2+/Co2+ transport
MYQITLEATPDLPYSNVQLRTRTWIFKDGAGGAQHTHGYGVIGKYPILSWDGGLGQREFSYCSLSGNVFYKICFLREL